MADLPQLLGELRNWREAGTLKEAVTTQRLGAELAAVETLLRTKAPELARLDELKVLAGQRDLVRLMDRALVAREAKRIRDCGTELERATTLEALKAWRQHSWKDVPEAGLALEAAFKTAWSEWCVRTFRESERLAEVLERLEPTRELGRRMLAAARAGLALRTSYPPGQAQRDSFVRAEETCRRCRDELSTGTGGARGVAELLLKAAEGKATLADVTPELRQWLSDQKVLGAFRLML